MMSNISTNTDVYNKNNELVVRTSEETISENLWIIGVSKTHPGLKYYFNTVTGVSLWNISREDMERAKITEMKANRNQHQYINCPEPRDPPPSKSISSNSSAQTYCEHISQQSQTYSNQLLKRGFVRETSGFLYDVRCTSVNPPPNIITVNFQPCHHSACMSSSANACRTAVPQNHIHSPTVLIDTTSEINDCNKNVNDLLGSKNSVNSDIAGTIVQDPSNEHNIHNESNTDRELNNHNSTSTANLDLTPLKMFSKNGEIKDKWYIIADADVYLHNITFLKSVINSDNQCRLMVPKNVKIELENATKTDLRTKAHCANYFIYKMFDRGFAHIEEDSSTSVQDKSNEEHILDCCVRLIKQNLFVVVISNDLEFQKYRNKMHIPIFTVDQLKDFLLKSNHCVTINSPKSTCDVLPSSNKNKLSPLNNLNSNNKVPDVRNPLTPNSDVAGKLDQNIQTSLLFRDNASYDICKGTADAEVQTNIQLTQSQEMKNAYTKTSLPNQNDDECNTKQMEISRSITQTSETSQHSNQRPGRRIKLKRKTICDKTESNISGKLVNRNASHRNVSGTMNVATSDDNLLMMKKLEDQNNVISKTNEHLKPSETRDRGVIVQLKAHNENIENKNVMFEVTSEIMEQCLKNRCDEWVSRFVQIMEEALTQVLRNKSSFLLPPPWNMYEAAICVKKAFNYDEDVSDAAKKFLEVLNRICDEKGNINANVSPKQYMEIYSFGVYMIDALQGIFSTCEDLQIAAGSLSKLLNDIQDPDSDMKNIEPLEVCMTQEECFVNNSACHNDQVELVMIVDNESLSDQGITKDTEKVPNLKKTPIIANGVIDKNDERSDQNGKGQIGSQLRKPIPIPTEHNTPKTHSDGLSVNSKCKIKSQEDDNVIKCNPVFVTTPSRYNLRTRKSRMSIDKQDKPSPKVVRKLIDNDDFKSQFLSNFSLQNNGEGGFKKNIATKDISKNAETSSNMKTNEGCSYKINNNPTDLSQTVNNTSIEPKIVRNFVICSDIEERLRTKRVYEEMEEFDYEDDIMEADYIDNDVPFDDSESFHIEGFAEHHNNVDFDRPTQREIVKQPGLVKIDFKYIISRIAQEIKELSTEIYLFSQNSCESLNLSTSHDKSVIRERAEKVYLYVDKLSTALTNMHNRDKNGGNNIGSLLKRNKFDISLDDGQFEVYRAFVTRCLEQTQYLKETIKDVVSAAGEI